MPAGCQAMADGSAVVCGPASAGEAAPGSQRLERLRRIGALCSLRSLAPHPSRESPSGRVQKQRNNSSADVVSRPAIHPPCATMASLPRFAPPGCNALHVGWIPSLRWDPGGPAQEALGAHRRAVRAGCRQVRQHRRRRAWQPPGGPWGLPTGECRARHGRGLQRRATAGALRANRETLHAGPSVVASCEELNTGSDGLTDRPAGARSLERLGAPAASELELWRAVRES